MVSPSRFLRLFLDFHRRPRGYKLRVNVRFGPNVFLSGKVGIGDYTFIGARSVIGPADVVIGRYTSIGPDTLVGINSHPVDNPSSSAVFYSSAWGRRIDLRKKHNSSPVVIGNDVWVGARSVIMPGVTVCDGAIIGACSVVTKDVGPYSIVAGVPARKIRSRFSQEYIEKLSLTKWWKFDLDELETSNFIESYSGQDLVKK